MKNNYMQLHIAATLFILISSLGCIKREELKNPSDYSSVNEDACQNIPKIPEGKGKIFHVTKDDAVKLVQDNYYSENKNVPMKNQIISCQTTFFWKVFVKEEGTIYIIDKVSGRLIQKLSLPTTYIEKNDVDSNISCKDAIQIAEDNFIEQRTAFGYSKEEIMEQRNDFYVISCELQDFWLITFEFNFFDISNFNSEDDLRKLPNIHPPTYAINKKTGKSFLLSN